MSEDIVLHEIKVRLRPYPTWDRLRIAVECLLFGEFVFRGEVSEDRPKPKPRIWRPAS